LVQENYQEEKPVTRDINNNNNNNNKIVKEQWYSITNSELGYYSDLSGQPHVSAALNPRKEQLIRNRVEPN